MHEMSLADALLEQVRRHTPNGQHAVLVRVEAGPLQSVDPDAFQMAWQAVTTETELEHCRLDLATLPYSLSCPKCGRRWTASDPFDLCACGNDAISIGTASGGSDLRLISMEVEPVEKTFSYL